MWQQQTLKLRLKKGRIARRKSARSEPKATAVCSGDEEIVPQDALSHTEMVAYGVEELLASTHAPEHLSYFSWKIKAAKYHPALASNRLGMAARPTTP